MEGGEALEFDQDADAVWRRTKETLAHLSTRVPQFDDEKLSAFATVDGGSIRAAVSEVAPGRSRLTVTARRYGDSSEPLARSVLTRIGEEVER